MKDEKLNIWSLIGLCAGIFAIVMGIVVMAAKASDGASSMKFGADFYTEIYYASHNMSWNLSRLIKAVKLGFGSLLLFFGIIDVCYILSRIAKDKPILQVSTPVSTIQEQRQEKGSATHNNL
ncbi:MAG: hypothetical protein FWE69_02795 [Clostridiales bacterium]|nr:hypothetical protein [Clostridiales bacterium]